MSNHRKAALFAALLGMVAPEISSGAEPPRDRTDDEKRLDREAFIAAERKRSKKAAKRKEKARKP